MLDCVVANGSVVIPYVGVMNAHLAVADGKVVRVFADAELPDAREVIDVSGKQVFPGIIDPHCHFGNFFPFVEDFERETRSAIAGGVTSVVTQLKAGLFSPELPPYEGTFRNALELLQGRVSVDYAFHFNLPTPRHIAEMKQHFEQFGVQSYKLHTGYKPRKETDGIPDVTSKIKSMSPGVDDGIIFLALRQIAELGGRQIPTFHCETDEIIEKTTALAKDAGMTGLAAWEAARPAIAEAHSIAKVAYLARALGSPMYVVHLSSGDGLAVVREELRLGTRMIIETCPHYLVLDTSREGTWAKVSPPVRRAEHAEQLWEGIEEGTITTIGSDHSAKMAENKGEDIWSAMNGFSAIETLFPVFYSAARHRGLDLVKIAELCSANAARTFGLYPQKGTLSVGSDADLVIVDPGREVTIEPGILHSFSDFTPFHGIRVAGWPVLTMLRGQVVYRDGDFVTTGQGRYLPRYP